MWPAHLSSPEGCWRAAGGLCPGPTYPVAVAPGGAVPGSVHVEAPAEAVPANLEDSGGLLRRLAETPACSTRLHHQPELPPHLASGLWGDRPQPPSSRRPHLLANLSHGKGLRPASCLQPPGPEDPPAHPQASQTVFKPVHSGGFSRSPMRLLTFYPGQSAPAAATALLWALQACPEPSGLTGRRVWPTCSSPHLVPLGTGSYAVLPSWTTARQVPEGMVRMQCRPSGGSCPPSQKRVPHLLTLGTEGRAWGCSVGLPAPGSARQELRGPRRPQASTPQPQGPALLQRLGPRVPQGRVAPPPPPSERPRLSPRLLCAEDLLVAPGRGTSRAPAPGELGHKGRSPAGLQGDPSPAAFGDAVAEASLHCHPRACRQE